MTERGDTTLPRSERPQPPAGAARPAASGRSGVRSVPAPQSGETSGVRRTATPPTQPRRAGTQRTGPAPVVPPQSVSGKALILVVAIMCFLACLAAGFLALVTAAASDWQRDIAREVTVQVKPVDGEPMDQRLAKVERLASATRGVVRVRTVSQEEGRRLVEPWLGSGIDLSQLPVPRLVVVELADPSTADLSGLAAGLKREVAGASLDDHSIWAGRLRTMAGAMVAAGVTVLVLVFVAMTLSIVFATRAATAGNRDVIEVLHFVGAEDRFIAREFQRHFLMLGLKGGTLGSAVAMLAFAFVGIVTRDSAGSALADQMQALFGGLQVGWIGYGSAAGIAVIVALITAVTSRLTVLRQLNTLD